MRRSVTRSNPSNGSRQGAGRLAALAAALFVAAAPLRAEDVRLPVETVRAAAVAAVQAGALDDAQALAQRLLLVDGSDPLARQVLAMVALARGDLPAARLAARAAYGAARSPRQKHEAAKIAAVVAAREERGIALRYWLRQAGDASPTTAERRETVAALNAVRDRSPWEARLRFSVSPSDNVNGGADSAFNIIDGRPEVGMLNGDAQALAGVVAQLGADLSWRLARGARSETRLTFGLDLERVRLTRAARRQAVLLTNGDLAESDLEIGLDHQRIDADGRGSWDFGLTLGLGDDGGSGTRSASLSVSRAMMAGNRTRLQFGAEWAVEQGAQSGAPVQRIPRLSLSAQHRLESGARLGLSLAAYEVQSVSLQRARHGGYAQLSFTPASGIGPFDISGAIGASFATYPDYRVGIITPPGGRQDRSIFGEVTLVAREVSWAGFSPQLTLRASRNDSNISRFDTVTTGVLLGLQSRF